MAVEQVNTKNNMPGLCSWVYQTVFCTVQYTKEEFREACLAIKELLRAHGRDDQIRPVAEAAAAEAAAAAVDDSDDQSQDESGSESSDESEYTPEAMPNRSAAVPLQKRRRGNATTGPAKKRSGGLSESGGYYAGDSSRPGGQGGVAKPLGKGALRELMSLACDMDSLPVHKGRSMVQLQPADFEEEAATVR